MPRPMGELRRLLAEYNSMVPAAQARGIRVRPYAAFNISRPVARQRVQWLRDQLAPFVLPQQVGATGALTFGVEFEFMMPNGMTREALAGQITAAGVDCRAESYNHLARTWWKLTTDGSLNDYAHGCELVSPPLAGEAGFEAMRLVTGVLAAAGCKVNKRCGLHVHIGVQNQPVWFFKNLIKAYHAFEGAIDSFLAPSRRGSFNNYCGPTRYSASQLDAALTIEDVARAASQVPGRQSARGHQRYRKVNLMSYWEHGTVEFRQHQGTVESRKTEMWVRLLLRLVEAARRESAAERLRVVDRSLNSLLNFVEANQAERAFFEERNMYFARREGRAIAMGEAA